MDDIEVMIESSQASVRDVPGLFVSVTTSNGFYESEWLDNPHKQTAVTITEALGWAVEQVSELYDVTPEDFRFNAADSRFYAEAELRQPELSKKKLLTFLQSEGLDVSGTHDLEFDLDFNTAVVYSGTGNRRYKMKD